METSRHERLKDVAVAYLLGEGCRAVAVEVGCPISQYRVDVAAYIDPLPKSRRWKPQTDPLVRGCEAFARGPRPKTVIIECKQCRADFLRDSRRLDQLIRERAELDHARRRLEETLIRAAEPHLRRSDTCLFPEMEEWDFSASRLESYRRVLRDLRRLDKQVHGQTKFWTVARYRLADILLIAAPAGLVRPRELPPGWGLLECPAAWLEDPQGPIRFDAADPGVRVTIAEEAPGPGRASVGGSKPEHQQRLLRNIAVAATRASLQRTSAW